MKLLCPRTARSCLQFERGDDNGSSHYAGRIEHIESGRVEFFYTTEEMCVKLKTILKREKARSR